MKALYLAGAFAVCTAVGTKTVAAGPNLLVNGSFELPAAGYLDVPGGSSTIPGWTTTLDGVEIFSHTLLGPWAPGLNPLVTIPDGVQAIDLPPVLRTGGGGIQQSFVTVPGERYDVSFFLGTAMYSDRDGTANITVTVDGQARSYALSTSSSDWDWKPFDFQFVASGASATIAFESFDDPATHFASVDGVSVTAAPDAGSSSALLLLSLGSLFAGRRFTGKR
jgi:hypothetical protein